MNRGSSSSTTAAYALLVLAVCLMGFTRPSQEAPASKRRAPLGPGALPAKASERSRDTEEHASTPQSKEAEQTIQRWLDSLADHPENLKNPPLEACATLSARAAEGFLRDPEHGWSPLLDVSRYAYLTHWEAMLPFHKALLERWADLDPDSLLLKLPPPDERDKAMATANALLEKAIESIDGSTAGDLLLKWFEGTGIGTPPASPFGKTAGKLMQAWTASDPESSWQWLKEKSLIRGNGWNEAARGYLLGLPNPNWPALMEAANDLDAIPLGGGLTFSGEFSFRQEVIRLWGFEDPIAALGTLDLPSKPVTRDNIDEVLANSSAYGPRHVRLIAEWLKANSFTAAVLEHWQPAHLDRDDTFTAIAQDGKYSDEVRDAARGLIRDPERLKEIDEYILTERKMRPIFDAPDSAPLDPGGSLAPQE